MCTLKGILGYVGKNCCVQLLLVSRAVHRKEKSYKCEFCEKSFSLKPRLARHIVIVHEEKKIRKCNNCDAKFGDKRDLRRHTAAKHEIHRK